MQYRFLIADGEMPSTKVIQRHWDRFAGRKMASSLPKTTTVDSVAKNAKKKQKAKRAARQVGASTAGEGELSQKLA